LKFPLPTQKRFGHGAERAKKGPNVSRKKMRKFYGVSRRPSLQCKFLGNTLFLTHYSELTLLLCNCPCDQVGADFANPKPVQLFKGAENPSGSSEKSKNRNANVDAAVLDLDGFIRFSARVGKDRQTVCRRTQG
jgi:hypothetical protein